MTNYLFALALAFLIAPVHAQQQATPQDLQRIIPALEAQRNQALTNHALAEAKASALQEENAKLKAEIEELKKANK
jgi:Skp family chaperone for outer membrane proteins